MEQEEHHRPSRYYEIDLLRFIAALSVVMFHFTYRGYHANHLSPVDYPALGEISKYGYLGVELFFIISGYVVLMSAQGKTLGQFFVSRVTRLFPAYWVACTLCFTIVRLFGPAVNTPGWSPLLDAPLKTYLCNMTMLQAFFGFNPIDGVYWTLTYEIIFYFLISLLISFQWFKHLVLVITIWMAYCAFIGPTISAGPFAFFFFPRYAPFFISGMLFYMLQTKQATRWKLYLMLLAAYALSLRSARTGLAETVHAFNQPFSIAVVIIIVTLCFGIFLLIIHRKINLGAAKWLTWAGALTYPLYLLHHNIGYVVLQRLGGKVNKHLLLVVMLVAMFILAYLLHVLVERRYSQILKDKLQRLLAKA